MAVLWRTGLRISEALALREWDFDRDAKTIRVMRGKGGKARTVGIDEQGATLLSEWLNLRRLKWDPPASAPVFCTRSGGQTLPSYARDMVRAAAVRAGLERRVHPHAFRHTFTVELVRAGVPLPHIQRLLGHASLATTSNYVASLSPEETLDQVRGREW